MVGIESHSLCPEYFSTTYGGMFKNSKRSYSMPFIVESALNKRPSSQINCKHGLYNNHTHNQNICTQSLSLVAFSILWTASECCECVMYVSSTEVVFVVVFGFFCCCFDNGNFLQPSQRQAVRKYIHTGLYRFFLSIAREVTEPASLRPKWGGGGGGGGYCLNQDSNTPLKESDPQGPDP